MTSFPPGAWVAMAVTILGGLFVVFTNQRR
jgi:hypothetical protein